MIFLFWTWSALSDPNVNTTVQRYFVQGPTEQEESDSYACNLNVEQGKQQQQQQNNNQ